MPGTESTSRKGPLFWVLTGGALLLVLLFGGILLTAWIGGRNFEPMESLRSIIRMDPNNETLEEDPAGKSIHFRNKKTGKEFIYRIDSDTNQIKLLPVEPAPKAPEK